MPTSTRRTDIDWLRIGAVYLLFFFHTAMVFNPAPFYHVRNGDVSIIAMIVAGFISLWHMPLLFLLAGWSVFSSLETRDPASFFKERVLKLFVPLVMCSALFGPPIKYVELRGGLDFGAHGLRVSHEQQESFASVIPRGLPVAEPFNERFLDFVPTFFSSLDRFTWSHLWFLTYLFTFTVLYYPVFRWIRRHAPRIGPVHSRWVFAPVVPLALIQVLLRPHWPGVQNLYDDWANFAYYSTYVLMGFLLACHPVLEDAIRRERKRALYVSLGAMVVLLLSVLRVVQFEPFLLACSAVAGWCFVVAVIGYGAGLRQRQTHSLDYLRESAFPIYLLHQPVIVLLGSTVVELSLGIPAKFALLLSGSIVATPLLYHYVAVRSRRLATLTLRREWLSPAGRQQSRAGQPRPRGARCTDSHGFASGSQQARNVVRRHHLRSRQRAHIPRTGDPDRRRSPRGSWVHRAALHRPHDDVDTRRICESMPPAHVART